MTVTSIASAAHKRGPRCGDVTVIAIDGPAGSGKTTLAARLGKHLNASVLHMDDVYNGWSGLRQGGQIVTRVLSTLAKGEKATYQVYDWHQGAYGPARTLNPQGILIVEGVGSVQLAHLNLLSVVVVVIEPDKEERLRRGLSRDGAQEHDHWLAWMEQENALHEEINLLSHADIIVDGTGKVAR